jgi:DNA-binding protein HU-beta
MWVADERSPSGVSTVGQWASWPARLRHTCITDRLCNIRIARIGPTVSSEVHAQPHKETHASHPGQETHCKESCPAKSAVQATVTLKHLAAALADSHDIAKKQAEAVLGDLVTLTTRHLKKGAKIRLTGLGILQVRKRAARMGRNPATGEAIKIKASKKVAFRPAREIKEAV